MRDALVEFKSARRPMRPRDLVRLVGYGAQHYVAETERLPEPSALALLLVVPSHTPTLARDAAELGTRLEPIAAGYYRLPCLPFSAYVVVADEVALAEADGLLAAFGTGKILGVEARRWLRESSMNLPNDVPLQELEDYDDVERRWLEQMPPERRLPGLSPEQVLARFAPEQRRAGLAPEEVLLALPDGFLQVLPEDFLGTLPPAVREAIRRRIGR